MVLDGNIAPTAWTNGGQPDARLSLSMRIGSTTSVAKTLTAFLSLCGLGGNGGMSASDSVRRPSESGLHRWCWAKLRLLGEQCLQLSPVRSVRPTKRHHS